MMTEQEFLVGLKGGSLRGSKAKAYDRALALGLPNSRHESWRLSDISLLYQHVFENAATPAEIESSRIEHFFYPDAARIVFVDGFYSAPLSRIAAGIQVEDLSLSENQATPEFFAEINAAFFDKGIRIRIGKNVRAELHLLHVSGKRENPFIFHPRCDILAEDGSNLTVIEDYVSINEGLYFTNACVNIHAARDSRVHHVRLQREDAAAFHIGTASVSLQEGSHYSSVSVMLGARFSRFNLNVLQLAEGVSCALSGISLVGKRQVTDTHTFVDHAYPHGKSTQLYKNIADGGSHAVFSGRVVVAQGAKGTDSLQSSRNLLLSEKAKIDAQPELEIFNDDVSCKHGATVGQIDPEEIFYLKSRGLSEKDSRNLLTYAFAAEIIDKIPVEKIVQELRQSFLERMAA